MPSFVALPRQRSALAALLLTALTLALCAPGCTRKAGLEAPIFPDREGPALLAALRAEFAPDRTLGYARARDVYFEHLMDTYGQIRGVYTGYTVTLTPGADPSQDAYRKGISTEHTWPQSMGTSEEPARSDLHYLFPVRADVNSARSNDPYAEGAGERALLREAAGDPSSVALRRSRNRAGAEPKRVHRGAPGHGQPVYPRPGLGSPRLR